VDAIARNNTKHRTNLFMHQASSEYTSHTYYLNCTSTPYCYVQQFVYARTPYSGVSVGAIRRRRRRALRWATCCWTVRTHVCAPSCAEPPISSNGQTVYVSDYVRLTQGACTINVYIIRSLPWAPCVLVPPPRSPDSIYISLYMYSKILMY
jgi:hypothetical protein